MNRKRLSDNDIEMELCCDDKDDEKDNEVNRLLHDRSFSFSPLTVKDLGVVSGPNILQYNILDSDDSVLDPDWIPELNETQRRSNSFEDLRKVQEKTVKVNVCDRGKYFFIKRKRNIIMSETESDSEEDLESIKRRPKLLPKKLQEQEGLLSGNNWKRLPASSQRRKVEDYRPNSQNTQQTPEGEIGAENTLNSPIILQNLEKDVGTENRPNSLSILENVEKEIEGENRPSSQIILQNLEEKIGGENRPNSPSILENEEKEIEGEDRLNSPINLKNLEEEIGGVNRISSPINLQNLEEEIGGENRPNSPSILENEEKEIEGEDRLNSPINLKNLEEEIGGVNRISSPINLQNLEEEIGGENRLNSPIINVEEGMEGENNIPNSPERPLNQEVIQRNQPFDKTNTKKNKAARVLGKPYLGYKKIGETLQPCVEKPARILKPRCSHINTVAKSDKTFLCGLISEAERLKLHSDFWKLETWEEKKAVIKTLAMRREIRRRRTKKRKISKRSVKKSGHDIHLNRPGKVPAQARVCKKFFLNTLCLGEDSFRRWTKENDEISDEGQESNNKASGVPVQMNSSLTNHIKTWLDLLPKVPSHYCRASSKKQYVESTFRSELHMHQVYKEWCQEKGHRVASRKTFLKVLTKENIAIHRPRKDQCDVCCSYKAKNISKDEYDQHIEKKEEARNAKKGAIAIASEKVAVITVDVQSVLLAPKLLASSMYYKLKLQCHNFTVYDTRTKKVTIYFWHEADGNVTANEFTTCLIDYIEGLPEVTEQVIIISDGCGHQNRNRILASALSDLSQRKEIIIQQLYLEKGHTMMEVDSVHSTIEKYIKPPIYAPADYITRMRQARPQNPYEIKSIHYDFFRNYEELSTNLKSIRPGKKRGDPVVVDLRGMKYLADGSIYYKLRHPQEWTVLPQRRQLPRQRLNAPRRLYLEPIKITESKFKHLQESKPVIDKDYHPFYDSLNFIPGV